MSDFKTHMFINGHIFVIFILSTLKGGPFELWHHFVNRADIKKSKNQWKINN
jgi:hypothetical protein